MKITVTELTNDVETHRMVVETDKATIGRAVEAYIQQRVQELGLVLDYCLYLTPEGEQVRFPLALELTKSVETPTLKVETELEKRMRLWADLTEEEELTDEEIQLQDLWYIKEWKIIDRPRWAEGRGYGYFPKEGL